MAPITPISALSLDKDLDAAWEQVMLRWQKETGIQLSNKRAPSIEEVVARINPPKATPSAKAKAKTVLMNVLTCVQRFGEMLSTGAGVLWGPGEQCVNAVTFVIQFVQDYSAVFENLAALLDRVGAFLERLKLYLEERYHGMKLERPMRFSMYKVLEHFVTILLLAHRLTDGWRGKFKLALKVGAFGDDAGVKAAMTELETLVADVTRTEVTLIYRNLNDAARNIVRTDVKVDQMLEKQNESLAGISQIRALDERRTAIDEEQREVLEIRRRLAVDAEDNWRVKQEDLARRQVPGSGTWLFDRYSMMRNWADASAPATAVFSIAAPENFGKSVLTYCVVNHLLQRYAGGQGDRRVAIGYYYFDMRAAESKDTVNAAVRAIIWQWVNADKSFAKAVKKALESTTDLGRSSDVWENLVLASAKTTDATFYMVLDGIDEAETELNFPLAQIVAAVTQGHPADGSLRFRMFLSGRDSGMRILEERADVGAIPGIRLVVPLPDSDLLPHETDLQMLVEEKLKTMEVFRGNTTDSVSGLTSRLPSELAHIVKGNYYQLNLKLKAIADSSTVEEVEEILRQVDSDTMQAITRNVDRLNKTLNRMRSCN